MVEKKYDWGNGADLLEHTKRKHKILKDYFREYLITRCKNRLQEHFRLAVVDGFSGAGRYGNGDAGSPIIFLEVLRQAVEEINLGRANDSAKLVNVHCTLILNDSNRGAYEEVQKNCAPLIAAIKEECPQLHLTTKFMNQEFEAAKEEIFATASGFTSVFFNLDQCGFNQVHLSTLVEIMTVFERPEVLLTFMINALTTFLSPDSAKNKAVLSKFDFVSEMEKLDTSLDVLNKDQWLGAAEIVVYNFFQNCARYVSTFAINNPDGYHYWLIHLAQKPKARQVYNDILHINNNYQAHYGRSGLNMLAFDPSYEGSLYRFDLDARTEAKNQLFDDIPKRVREYGDAVSINDFFEDIYKSTPAHSEDINSVIIDHPDLIAKTPNGNPRQKSTTITDKDTIVLNDQKSFFTALGIPKKAVGE